MALDIHKFEKGKHGELLFQIDDALYALLEPSFELFRQRTGLCIDPYGDLIFSSGLDALIRAVSDCSGNLKPDERRNYSAFLRLLRRCENTKTHIVFLGD